MLFYVCDLYYDSQKKEEKLDLEQTKMISNLEYRK